MRHFAVPIFHASNDLLTLFFTLACLGVTFPVGTVRLNKAYKGSNVGNFREAWNMTSGRFLQYEIFKEISIFSCFDDIFDAALILQNKFLSAFLHVACCFNFLSLLCSRMLHENNFKLKFNTLRSSAAIQSP